MALAERAAAHGRVAIDTEFVSERRYQALLCLAQVAVPDPDAADGVRTEVIDPLGDDPPDPAPLARVLADPAVEVVVHAGRQDIAILRRAWDTDVTNVFDTQLAAGFIGCGNQEGYESLVRKVLGVQLKGRKRSRRTTNVNSRSNCLRRPRQGQGSDGHHRRAAETALDRARGRGDRRAPGGRQDEAAPAFAGGPRRGQRRALGRADRVDLPDAAARHGGRGGERRGRRRDERLRHRRQLHEGARRQAPGGRRRGLRARQGSHPRQGGSGDRQVRRARHPELARRRGRGFAAGGARQPRQPPPSARLAGAGRRASSRR